MLIFQFIKKIFDRVIAFFQSIAYRWEKKSDNVRGYAFGGPKKSKRMAVILLLTIVALVAVAVGVKQSAFLTVNQILERETVTGPKVPTDYRPSIKGGDLRDLQVKAKELLDKVDCEEILNNLKLRGTLTVQEKNDFDRACRDQVGADMASLVDKITSGEIPKEVVADLMKEVNKDNIKNVLRALDNDAVRNSLKTDAGKTIARNLSTLGNLSDKELDKAVKSIQETPPQFRDDVVSAIKSVSKMSSPEARGALLDSIAAARSKEELKDIQEFAEVAAKGSDDEERVFADAWKKAGTRASKKALTKAVTQIVEIPADDPVRGKLVNFVEEISKRPVEEQEKFYTDVADTARIYNSTTDPALKAAMADAIMQAKSLEDLSALADRLRDLETASSTGALDKETALLAIEGVDQEAMDRVKAAALLVRDGETDLAKKVLTKEVPYSQVKDILAAKEAKRSRSAPLMKEREFGEPSKKELDELVKKKDELETKKSAIEAEVRDLVRMGVDPTDQKISDLYSTLSQTRSGIADYKRQISEIRGQLVERLSGLKERYNEDFARYGVVVPHLDMKLPEDDPNAAQPSPRLSQLREIDEFWAVDGSSLVYDDDIMRKKRRRIRSGPKATTILDSITAGKAGETWYALNYGAGGQSGGAAAREFEMSRLLRVPGIVRRIPEQGIPSGSASRTIIEFTFLTNVANRLTGQIEIPEGSVALCKVRSFSNSTGRLEASCDTVDTGGRQDIRVDIVLCDPSGTDGLPGKVVDNRGWHLAGIFLTAFSQSILDAFSGIIVEPFEVKAQKTAADYVVIGAGGGTGGILQDVAQKQIQEWQNADTFWIGFDGLPATVRQK